MDGITQISIKRNPAPQMLMLSKSSRASANQTIGQTISDRLLTTKRAHLLPLQFPKLMKGQLSLVSLKKISHFFLHLTFPTYPHLIQRQQKERKIFPLGEAVDLNLLEEGGSTALFLNYSMNFFGLLQGQILLRKQESIAGR
jgi:hypothetical protein